MDGNKKLEENKLSNEDLENVSGGDFLSLQRDSQQYASLIQPIVGPVLTDLSTSWGRKNKEKSYDHYKKSKDYATFAKYFNENRDLDAYAITADQAEFLFNNLSKKQMVDLMLLSGDALTNALQCLFPG